MEITAKINAIGLRVNRLLAALVLVFSLSAAQAFSLVPIRMEFAPAGRGANQSFRLENNSTNTVPVQISMLTREVDLNGLETNAPAEGDFLVFPPQLVLKPNHVQTVRVKWLGTPKPGKELAYRILAEQLPVELDKEAASKSRINMLLRYLGSVYIVPKGAAADVVLESAVAKNNAEGQRGLELVFHNRGSAHAILEDLRIKLRAGDKTVELGPEALPHVTGENMLAGQKRRFSLPWPDGLTDGPLQVTFDFSKSFKP